MLYIFDNYMLDTDHYTLLRDQAPLQIEPKVFDLLAFFLDHRGDVITKKDLLEQLWPDQPVTESALTYCIMAARKAIGDNGQVQRRIKTVHGRGYCFIGMVEETGAAGTGTAAEPSAKTLDARSATATVPPLSSAPRKFTYWQQTAQEAITRSAYMEAAEALRQGIEALKSELAVDIPDQTLQDLTLQVTLSTGLSTHNNMPPQTKERAYLQAKEYCMPMADSPPLFQIQQGLWAHCALQAELTTAQALGERCLALTQNTQNPIANAWAWFAVGLTLFEAGELSFALQHFEQSLDLQQNQSPATSSTSQDLGIISLAYAARAQWHLGESTPALQRMETALSRAQELGQPIGQALALISAAQLDHIRRDTALAHERAEAALSLATQHNLPHWAAQGRVLAGWVRAVEGQIEAGLELIRHSVESYRETGAALAEPVLLAVWADAATQAGHLQEGLAVIDRALKLVGRMGGKHHIVPELYRLKGVCLTPEAPSEAEDWLRRAIGSAARQRAKCLELRAAVSLGELWQQQGDTTAIRPLLLPRMSALSDAENLMDMQAAQRLLAG